MRLPYLTLAAGLMALAACSIVAAEPQNPAEITGGLRDTSNIPKEFIRRQGTRLVAGPGDQPVLLQGVCFGNQVWGNPKTPPATHHDEADFQRVRDMRMNVIRFYLNYALFEDDRAPYTYKPAGWEWLDRNIQWAKKHGIYLILNMHYPQGGFQSNGDGLALWDNSENQNRLTALYRAIAEHCRQEPTVAAYDLVNEPVVSKALEQWRSLAVRLTEAIRSVDRNHLIIVERLNAIKGQWKNDENMNFFLLNDANLMYTFHFYSPIEYSHQTTSWTGLPEDGSYPDPIIMPPSDTTWCGASFGNAVLPAGDTDWKEYVGEMFLAKDPKFMTAKPALVGASNHGSAWFGDFVVKEFDANRSLLRVLWATNVTSMKNASFWSKNKSGKCQLAPGAGPQGRSALEIQGTTDDSNYALNIYRFKVTPGHYYQLNGFMKGRQVSPGARCMFRLDFETSPSGGRIMTRNREYLAAELKQYLDWGKRNNVPLYVGEWGLFKRCFDEGKGGLNWVSDMMSLLTEAEVHFTYHTYHETGFGLYYYDSNTLPDPAKANTGLIKLFTQRPVK
ncbi:MAG: cellulase family glycosylhydrolase [Verrucomicrobiota bacterium]